MEYWSIGVLVKPVLRISFLQYSITPTLQYSNVFALGDLDYGLQTD